VVASSTNCLATTNAVWASWHDELAKLTLGRIQHHAAPAPCTATPLGCRIMLRFDQLMLSTMYTIACTACTASNALHLTQARASQDGGQGRWPGTSTRLAVVTVSTRRLNMSRVRAANLLPRFTNVTSPGDGFVSPQGRFTPVDMLWDDGVPDDLFEHVLNHSYAKLPHRVVDDYDRAGADGTASGDMPTVVAESGRLRATFYPRTGGKLGSLVDTKTGRELLFNNPV
jgi:hypothetical protein